MYFGGKNIQHGESDASIYTYGTVPLTVRRHFVQCQKAYQDARSDAFFVVCRNLLVEK